MITYKPTKVSGALTECRTDDNGRARPAHQVRRSYTDLKHRAREALRQVSGSLSEYGQSTCSGGSASFGTSREPSPDVPRQRVPAQVHAPAVRRRHQREHLPAHPQSL